MAWIKALVIGMAVLIVVGFVVVATTLINRANDTSEADADGAFVHVEGPLSEREDRFDEPVIRQIGLAPGESLLDASLDGDALLLRIAGPQGTRLEVRGVRSGALLGSFEVVEAAQ